MTKYCVETASGKFVNTHEPDPSTIDIEDMAWALSRQARMAGHSTTEEIYSIAQHAVFCTTLVELLSVEDDHWPVIDSLMNYATKHLTAEEIYAALEDPSTLMHVLLHDNAEAYLTDIPSPVKRNLHISKGYNELEEKMDAAIYKACGIPEITPAQKIIVRWADLAALKIEAHYMIPSRGVDWNLGVETDGCFYFFPSIRNWKSARDQYLEVFFALKKKLHTPV